MVAASARYHARYYLDGKGAMALAEIKAATRDEAMAAALKRRIGFVASPPLVMLYENDVPVARCVDCFDGKGGTWSMV